MGLSDGLAGLVGQYFGRWSYRITGRKTVEGSLTFFGVTVIILLFIASWQNVSLDLSKSWLIIGGALLLTIVEAVFSRGWDNLPVPLLAGLILYALL